MRRVVDGRAVEQDERLVRAAAAHVEAGGKVARGLDARQQLEAAEDVGLQDGRERPDVLDGQRRHADAAVLLLALAVPRHLHLRPLLVLRTQFHVVAAVGDERQRLGLVREADVRDGHAVAPRREREGVEAGRVGDGAGGGAARFRYRLHGGRKERLARLRVADVARERDALRDCRRSGHHGDQNHEKAKRRAHRRWGEGHALRTPAPSIG